jgi:hypothetical protein
VYFQVTYGRLRRGIHLPLKSCSVEVMCGEWHKSAPLDCISFNNTPQDEGGVRDRVGLDAEIILQSEGIVPPSGHEAEPMMGPGRMRPKPWWIVATQPRITTAKEQNENCLTYQTGFQKQETDQLGNFAERMPHGDPFTYLCQVCNLARIAYIYIYNIYIYIITLKYYALLLDAF